jgi:hypothetical protein
LAKTYLYYYYIIKETNDFMRFPLKKGGDQKEGIKRRGSKGGIKREPWVPFMGSLY